MNDTRSTGVTERHLECSERLARELRRVADCIDAHDEFLVASHLEPDGDAAGSMLALAMVLEELGKTILRFNRDGVPGNMSFLEGADAVRSEPPTGSSPDVVVLLDCSEPGRAGLPDDCLEGASDVVIIDHHDTLDLEGSELVVHDPEAAATGELVFRLMGELDVGLSTEIARAIYATLVSDTGSFQYANTNRSTFRIAGELVDAGVCPWEITLELFESQPERRIRLLGEVLQTLELSSCGRLAFIEIDREMLDGVERPSELVDGFINYGRSIRGVEVSTQFRERDSGEWKVSFRSKGRVDVGEIAARFGGGGHVNAAGFTTERTPGEMRDELEATLDEVIDEA